MRNKYMRRIDEWRAAYAVNLHVTMLANPGDYMPGICAHEITDKTKFTILNSGLRFINIPNSKGWKLTAKQFGIKNTYKAWEQWFKQKEKK